MIFADFGLGRGGGRHRPHRPHEGGGFYPMSFPVYTPEYVMPPVVLTPPAATGPCATWPTPPPPCPNGTLVWTDSKTVCCKVKG